MLTHFSVLRAEIHDQLVRRGGGPRAADGRLPSCGLSVCVQAGAACGDGRDRRGCVNRDTFSSLSCVVLIPAVVGVPESLQPLHKLQVVPEEKGRLIRKGRASEPLACTAYKGHSLHLAFHQSLDRYRLCATSSE